MKTIVQMLKDNWPKTANNGLELVDINDRNYLLMNEETLENHNNQNDDELKRF